MAWLELPGGERQYIFGKGGAEREAVALDAKFLGAIRYFQSYAKPLTMAHRWPPESIQPLIFMLTSLKK